MLTKVTLDKHYINGEWISSSAVNPFNLVQPASEEHIATLMLGNSSDVDNAVAAAKTAFQTFSLWSQQERLGLLKSVLHSYQSRFDDLVTAVCTEMGAPLKLSRAAQVPVGENLLCAAIETLEDFEFSSVKEGFNLHKEPIGVAGLITPWNWPLNQIVAKVAAGLATGCSMVLKPSEYAPISAAIFAEILHEAGVPKGVFNLVQGAADVGAAMSVHKDIDLISITGSTRAGIAVAVAAAPTVKRVTQELGGKSPYLVLPGTVLADSIGSCIRRLTVNNGQSCNAPTRLLISENEKEAVYEEIKKQLALYSVGDSFSETADIGPLVNKNQFERVNHYISRGMEQGATLLAGGPGRPEGLEKGYFVKPTVFTDVDPSMDVVQDEIFGPVVSVMTYSSVEEAIAIANDTEYGLTAYVYGKTQEDALQVAKHLRAGMVHVNDANAAMKGPFGGYKMSGNGRERGEAGFEEYLEIKSVFVKS